MTREEILLKQNELFSERKLHFGRLFWQTPTIFIAICVLVASLLKDLQAPVIWWFILTVGALLVLVAYIGFRHKKNEDQYEQPMRDIETELAKNCEEKMFHAPLSKAYGARFATSVALLAIGALLIVLGFLGVGGII